MEMSRLALVTELQAFAGFKFESHDYTATGGEDSIVRYYRDPDDSAARECGDCGKVMHDHGWIDHGDHGHVVCPGDYVIFVGGACRGADDKKGSCIPVKAILVESGLFEVRPSLPIATEG